MLLATVYCSVFWEIGVNLLPLVLTIASLALTAEMYDCWERALRSPGAFSVRYPVSLL
jgi:hypothetical protein